MNREDLEAKRIYDQARPPAMGTPFNASTAGGNALTSGTVESSTLQDASGNPLRLWIHGVDPFNETGYYFGNHPLPEITS